MVVVCAYTHDHIGCYPVVMKGEHDALFQIYFSTYS